MGCIICKRDNSYTLDREGYLKCPSCSSSFPARLIKENITLEEMRNMKGAYEKIEIANHILIDQYEDIANHFIPKILGVKKFCITDESSLLDLNFKITKKGIKRDTDKDLEKIKKVYGVDVSDIEDLNLQKIFERLRMLSPVFN